MTRAVDCIDRNSIKYYPGTGGYMYASKGEIDKLPQVTPQEPRWIPVSERLPEKNMDCLVAVGEFNFTEIASYSDLMGIIDHKIFHQGEVGHDSFENITEHVKAWMPLPPDYKEVKKDSVDDPDDIRSAARLANLTFIAHILTTEELLELRKIITKELSKREKEGDEDDKDN